MEEIEIAELREKATALQQMLKEVVDAEIAAVKAFVQTLTSEPVYVRHSYNEWGFDIAMLDPKTGYGMFATEISVCYEGNYGRNRITFNTGCCGSFGMDNEGQVFKYRMMAALIDHADELEAMAKAFNTKYQPLREKHWEIQRAIERWESNKEAAERDAKRAEVLSNVAPGAWFEDPKGDRAYLVIKKTEKMVFFKYYQNRISWADNGLKFWRNEDGWKNETNTHTGFADKIILNGWQLATRPEGVNP